MPLKIPVNDLNFVFLENWEVFIQIHKEDEYKPPTTRKKKEGLQSSKEMLTFFLISCPNRGSESHTRMYGVKIMMRAFWKTTVLFHYPMLTYSRLKSQPHIPSTIRYMYTKKTQQKYSTYTLLLVICACILMHCSMHTHNSIMNNMAISQSLPWTL